MYFCNDFILFDLVMHYFNKITLANYHKIRTHTNGIQVSQIKIEKWLSNMHLNMYLKRGKLGLKMEGQTCILLLYVWNIRDLEG